MKRICWALVALTFGIGPLASIATARSPSLDWRRVATSDDRARLRGWRTALVKGLSKAQASGYGAEIAREGALLVPDAAIGKPDLPEGNYTCRVIKLGANGAAMSDFTAYPAFSCKVDEEGDVASFKKMSGSQRPTGLIFADGNSRSVFLGTMMLGDERRPVDYGADADRDMAGQIERVGDKRWRIILPYPKFESVVDVIELVPSAG